MEVRPMEITLVRAEDLKNVRLLSKKMDVFAKVSVLGDPGSTQKQKTPVDKGCGSTAEWNHEMKFIINEGAAQQDLLTLKIKISTQRTLRNTTPILTFKFPIKKLFDEKDMAKSRQYLTDSITSDGNSLGTLYWMYKFGEKYTTAAPHPGGSSSSGTMVQKLGVGVTMAVTGTLLDEIIDDDDEA